MKKRHLALAALCLVALPEFAAAQRPAEQDIVWPLPPNAPRIRYVGQLKGEADIGRTQGLLSRMRDRLAGTDSDGSTEMTRPQDVYNLGSGRIFVSDATKSMVLLFDTEAQEVRLIGDTGQGQLGKPMGMDGDDVSTVYVADPQSSRVVAFDRDGQFVAAYGGTDVLHNPVDVAVDVDRDALWVVDSYLHQTVKFSLSSGEVLLRIGLDDGDLAAKREALRNRRAGIHGTGMPDEEIPPDEDLVNGSEEEAESPDPEEELVNVARDLTENRGSGEGEFRYPGFVAVAPDGTVYVTDQMNFRIQAFTPGGEYVRTVGRHARTAGGFARPKGIDVDSRGHLYVADALFNNIQIFDDQGRLLLFFSEPGPGEGEMFMPLGLSIDAQDQIWVADRTNERVQIFQYLHVAEGNGEGGSD